MSQEVGRGEEEERGRKGQNKEGKGREQRYEKKFVFWNMAGVGNKDRDFWNYIKGFDFISLSETWMDEKRWENWRGRLPKLHEWECSHAVRDKNRGRVKGDFIIGKKIEWNVKRCKLIGKEEEGMVMTNIKMEKERINIVSVYDVHGSKKRKDLINLWEKRR